MNHINSLGWRRYLDAGWRAWALPLHDDGSLCYTLVHLMERGDEWLPAIEAVADEIRRRPSLVADGRRE